MLAKPVKHALLLSASVVTFWAGFAGIAAAQAPADQNTATDQADEQAVEEIVVTGSYIRRKNQLDQPSPISVLGSEDFAAIGANQVADLTFTLTINQGAQNNPDAFTQNLTTGTENINLRGLGVQSTLVLLNGKRQVSSAAQTDQGLSFVDTASLVPFIAIDRLEVLKDGAAALYGTDAVAGVANFNTRKNFKGFEVQGEFRTANFDASDTNIGAIFGSQGEKTRLTASFAYLDRTPLTSRERDLRGRFANSPFLLQESSQTAFPPNIIIPTANATFAANNPTLFAQYQSVLNQNTALFNFTVPGPGGTTVTLPVPASARVLPVLPSAALGAAGAGLPPFLVGTFAGFFPNAAVGGSDPLGIADGFTASVLPGILPIAFPGFSTAALSPAQQAQLGATLGAVQSAQTAALLGGNPGFSTPIVPDPACAAAAAQSSLISLIPGQRLAGGGAIPPLGACSYNFGPTFNIIPRTTRIQFFTQVEHDFNDNLTFYGEFGYARNRNVRGNSNFPVVSPTAISATNPFNTFGQGVFLVTRSPGSQQVDNFFAEDPNFSNISSDTYRVVAGLKGNFSKDWSFDISYTRAANDYLLNGVSDGLDRERTLALAGLGGNNCNPVTGTPGQNGCLFYNPFGSGATASPTARAVVRNAAGAPVLNAAGQPVTVPVLNSREVLDYITGEITFEAQTDLTVVDAVTSGKLFSLPAGDVGVALGFQYRDERLSQAYDENTNAGNFLFVTEPTADFDSNRDVIAFFGEVAIPITKDIDLSGAVRYEGYGESIGSTVNPKVSLIYRTAKWLSFRGSWGTSFRAPSLFQSFGNQTSLNSVVDSNPATAGAPFIAIRTNGNPNLGNERSRAFNVGFTVEPISKLKLSVDYWNFNFRNLVTEFDPDTLVARSVSGLSIPTGASVTRNPTTGALSTVTTVYTNQGFIRTNGVDINGNYVIPTSHLGIFNVGIDLVYTIKFDIPDSNGLTFSALDSRNALTFADPVNNLRGNLSFGWAAGGHSLVGFARYTSGYRDDQACTGFVTANPVTRACPAGTTNLAIGHHTTYDLQYNFEFKGGLPGTKSTTFSIGVVNLTNNAPPEVFTNGGYDPRSADPRGRLGYVRLKAAF